jgi:type I restriction enzyme S subunit
MTDAIDITTEQRKLLLVFLRRFIPGVAVWAFGSRVKWTARPNSDLDLVVFTSPEQKTLVSELKDTIAESNIPFIVDLHVWDEIPENFRSNIEKEHAVLVGEKDKKSRGLADEWSSVVLGNVVTLQRGFDLPAQNRNPGKVPIVSSSGISGYHSKVGVAGPGVITGRYGTIGQVFLIKEDYWPLNTTLWVKDFHGNDPQFSSYLLRTVDFHSCSDKSSVPGVNRNDLHRIPVLLPPLPEQKAIASVLGALDDKIDSNRRTSQALERLARAIFRAWFVDFEPVKAKASGKRSFPGMPQKVFDSLPTRLVESELGPVPEGWEVIPLYNTAKFINGAAFKNEDFCARGEGLPVVKIVELKQGVSPQTKWSLRQADADQLINTGDLLYSWSGSPDTSLDAFLWSSGRGLLNQHIFKVETPTSTQKRFVYYLLKSLRLTLVEIARNKQTTGLGHVTVADMKCLLVCKPSKDVLVAFDNMIGPIFDKAFAATIESQSLSTLRDYLLPKLLSGEVRVTEVLP